MIYEKFVEKLQSTKRHAFSYKQANLDAVIGFYYNIY